MTNASELQEKVFATFYLGDSVLFQGTAYYSGLLLNTVILVIAHILDHPSFSDFTYHFPERVAKTKAPI
jgi:hypothetical protein